ncbi:MULTISPECIES: LytR C-terminal domain-containing protein [Actinomycetes]|uniref:LytR/CpsA/Psr regulator C-terminal domain-containing protein n=2 Tax=Actinomycetes TaxID=1760 RepID=A0ABP6LT48_9MICC
MSKFPHDEFDDVPPYQQGEAGKHRAPAEASTGSRGGGLKWIGLLAVLALAVGVVSYFVLPTLRDGDTEASDQDQAQEESDGEDEGSEDGAAEDGEEGAEEEPTGTAADTEAAVQVLGYEGAESEAAATLEEMGYNVTYVAEWTYDDVETPVVFYPAGSEEHAEDVGQNLGIERVEENSAWSSVAVVVDGDFAE